MEKNIVLRSSYKSSRKEKMFHPSGQISNTALKIRGRIFKSTQVPMQWPVKSTEISQSPTPGVWVRTPVSLSLKSVQNAVRPILSTEKTRKSKFFFISVAVTCKSQPEIFYRLDEEPDSVFTELSRTSVVFGLPFTY